jgi:hypothetical protein
MSESPDCKPLIDAHSVAPSLPTRQKHALCLLFDKPNFTPEEVAALDYRTLERAPGIGKNSLALIRAWLNSNGYEMPSLPPPPPNQRDAQRQRKLERAIDYLRWNGYEVHHSS